MCGFVWTARSGQEHRCVRTHRTAGSVMHVCECGATLHPNRQHPPGHSAYVAEAARRQNDISRATATRSGKPWSPEEDLRLRELAVGIPISKVARLLKRTIWGVRHRISVLGIHVGSKNPGKIYGLGVVPEERDV